MYDLWYTLGAAVMDPGLVTKLITVNPVFTKVTRMIVEWANPQPLLAFFPPSSETVNAGLLDANSTPAVRKAIRSYLEANKVNANGFIPPISIYTAGKMCQLLNVPSNTRFQKQIIGPTADTIPTGLNQAYLNAKTSSGKDPKSFSPGFPALLGLLAIDQQLCTSFSGSGADATQAVAEFGINTTAGNPELPFVKSYISDPAFTTAQSLLIGQDGPWRTTCGDQFVFWANQNVHAIM